MRILVTGYTGQVGKELYRSLSRFGTVIPAGQTSGNTDIGDRLLSMDLAKPDEIIRAIRGAKPDIIVNPAAYTAVDQAEADYQTAHAVNGEAPAVLAREARSAEIPLIHFSTDYVYGASSQEPLDENQATNPLNAYGRTKLAGDLAVEESGADYLILRTSWVYANEGANFVRTMLKLFGEREEISVVDDQIGSPTSARLLADLVALICSQARSSGPDFWRRHRGVYHATASGYTSWHQFAEAIRQAASSQGRALKIKNVRPIPTSEFPKPAKRPLNSRLDCGKLEKTFHLKLPHWHNEMIWTMNEMARSL